MPGKRELDTLTQSQLAMLMAMHDLCEALIANGSVQRGDLVARWEDTSSKMKERDWVQAAKMVEALIKNTRGDDSV